MTGAATVGLQLGCLAIVCLYVGLRVRRTDGRREFVARFLILMVASWLAENTCIRLYGFYAYDPSWWGFIDQVPLLIVAIWPVVIHSALDLADGLSAGCRTRARVAVIGALIVLTDAALIEPIAVRVGLWRWTEPGLFEVPPIGVLGWAVFTWFAVSVFVYEGKKGSMRVGVKAIAVLLIAPLGVHLVLLAAWWGLFRHINGTIDEVAGVIAAGVVAVATVISMMRAKTWPPVGVVMMRGPGAGFFFVLLILHALDDPWLTAYAVCFAVPWIVLVWQSVAAERSSARIA